MEKTLTPDEKIKRAEEIYYRKKMQNINKKSATVNVSNKKDFSMFKKMILQIIICILIYVIFYMIKNTNYIFSEDVINKTKEILSYDINIKHLYQQGIDYLNSFSENVGAGLAPPASNNILELNETNAINSSITNEIQTNEVLDNVNTNFTEEQNIGGGNIETIENSKKETTELLSQMEKDAKAIIGTKSLIIPLKGTITSRFGEREPKTATVPKNHTGIDIAVNEGTVFVAAMSGVVEEVSSRRRFRKSF